MRKGLILTVLLLLNMLWFVPFTALAEGTAKENMTKAEEFVTQALDLAKQGKLDEAKQAYKKFNSTWRDIEDGVKEESAQAYKEIESSMGKVVYAQAINKQDEIVKALESLQAVNEKFIRGQFAGGQAFKQESITLADFIKLLEEAKATVTAKDQTAALQAMDHVTDSWLSIEGAVVAQSAQVYSDSERDMVTVSAMLSANPPDYQGALSTLEQMIAYLTPLAAKSGYTMWDAMMIIIREGLEALLVVTALLAYVNKSAQLENSGKNKGKAWIWAGVSSGLLISTALAFVVKFIFDSGAFGNNNALIAGWTGVIAAVMLLYVSYWLHSQSHIANWQQFIKSRSETALHAGRLLSLGIISFLAVFREGTETVLFFIGMVNQISLQDMLLGLLFGFGLLAVLAYLMIIIGLKLPIRPFFIVSSIIVFYLCVKFTGMGIHSLQLADVIPSSPLSIPSVDLLALYPSLESTIPQLLLVLSALAVVLRKKLTAGKQETITQ